MTLQDKATKVNQDIQASFGGDTPLVDIVTNQSDPLVNLVTTVLAGQITLEDAFTFLKSGLYANDVSGQDLTLLAQLSNTPRKLDQPSKAAIIVSGLSGAILPAGAKLVDSKGNEWETLTDAVISRQYGFTNACSPVGAFDLANGELILQDEWPNITSATNAAAPVLGGTSESDSSLRARLLDIRPQWQNKGTQAALNRELNALPDVLRARVITKLPDCFSINCNDPVASIKKYMVAVLGGEDLDIAETIFSHLCFGTDRLTGDTSVDVRCDTVKFQRMCPVIVNVKYWFKCSCPAPLSADTMSQLIADRLNARALYQSEFGINDLCGISKDLIKIQFEAIPKTIIAAGCECPIIFDNPITGETDVEYCTDDLNSHCYIKDCAQEGFQNCLILQPWWYPVFLVDRITEGAGCPCPLPDDGCGCAQGG